MLFLNIKNYVFFILFCILVSFSFSAKASGILRSLVENALENNNSYLSSVLEYKSSLLLKDNAKSYLYPTIDLSASIYKNWSSLYFENSKYDTNPVSHPYNYSIRLTQILFSMETFAQLSKVDLQLLQGELSLEAKKNDIMAQVINAYLDFLETRDSLIVIDSKKTYLQNQKESVEKKYELGLARKLDVSEVESSILSLTYQETMLKNLLDIRLMQLKNLVQMNTIESESLKEDWSNILPEMNSDLAKWQENALSTNLDILQLETAIQVANKDLTISNYSYYPTLSLSADYGHTFYNIDSEKDNDRKIVGNASIGLNFKMNIYSGGRDNSQTKKVELNIDSLNYKLKSAQDSVKTQIAVSYNSIVNLVSQLKYQQSSVLLAKENQESISKSYQLGLKDNSDVLLSIDKLYNEQVNLLKTKYNILKNIIDLRKNSGSLSIDDINLIDNYFN